MPTWYPLGKCAVHRFDNLIRLVVFDFGVNIHRDFTALVTCQVLHRFGVNRGMNQVGYVGVSELVGSNLKIQTVNTVTVVPGLLSQLRIEDIFRIFPVYQLSLPLSVWRSLSQCIATAA